MVLLSESQTAAAIDRAQRRLLAGFDALAASGKLMFVSFRRSGPQQHVAFAVERAQTSLRSIPHHARRPSAAGSRGSYRPVRGRERLSQHRRRSGGRRPSARATSIGTLSTMPPSTKHLAVVMHGSEGAGTAMLARTASARSPDWNTTGFTTPMSVATQRNGIGRSSNCPAVTRPRNYCA